MDNNFERELWVKAQENAKRDYEEEYGSGSWDEADKYEREDWCFTEYDRLRKERETMAQMRDSKGRFISKNTTEYGNNVTTNTILNKKGNDTMMNRKMTNAEERTMKLAQAGISTDNFFNLTLSVPFGKEVRILVDGKEMVVPSQTFTDITTTYSNPICGGSVNSFGVPTFVTSNGDICNAETGEVLVFHQDSIDSIAQRIIEDGYVKNNRLFRRFVGAQTMRFLAYEDRRNSRRTGWEACMKDCYSYGYQFEQLKDELHTLAKLQKEDPEYFAERTKFFNGDVVVATLNDYLYRLKKYVKKQTKEHPRNYRNHPYCKLARYGNILVKDLDVKVFIPIQERINVVKSVVEANRYDLIEREFNVFMDKFYNKLPYETPKCAVWKDAYKASGAFYSLQNFIRYHKVILEGCRDKYDSEAKLYNLLNTEFKGCEWRFHQLLVDAIEYNNFDLRRSIAEGNKAEGTTSTKALVYKR